MIVHVLRGDSVDPVGDFVAINQELELFNPKLAEKLQVVVVNKIDIPEVRAQLDDLTRRLKKAAGHTRVMGISAATGENVKELMQRVRKVVESLPVQSDFELFTEEEERVSFDDPASDKFEVFTDDRFPGQFRVVGDKIEKVQRRCRGKRSIEQLITSTALCLSMCLCISLSHADLQVADTMNWDYYESVDRFQRILDAHGITEALKENGAKEGDLVMIGAFVCVVHWWFVF